MMSNLGLNPKELIGTSRNIAFARINSLRKQYITKYKTSILTQISHEISV
jgi:hypothetical protein